MCLVEEGRGKGRKRSLFSPSMVLPMSTSHPCSTLEVREGEREGGREGGRERGREGREGGREVGREGGREGEREGAGEQRREERRHCACIDVLFLPPLQSHTSVEPTPCTPTVTQRWLTRWATSDVVLISILRSSYKQHLVRSPISRW